MNSAPNTSSINGLVGLLTQALNHDCETNQSWVLARIAARPRCQGIQFAIPVAEF